MEYITKADDYLNLIRNKLAQAGVKGRPSAAALPWFDLQGNPMDFSLRAALGNKSINAETLEKLGEEVSSSCRTVYVGNLLYCCNTCCRCLLFPCNCCHSRAHELHIGLMHSIHPTGELLL